MEKAAEQPLESVRVDLWTWAVRLFKSRSLAASACKKAQLLVNGQRCRPARQLRVGDELTVKQGDVTRTVEVKALLEKRIGAKLVGEFVIDRTPLEEYERAAAVHRVRLETVPHREPGAGRPTKRDRRSLDELLADAGEEKENFELFVKSLTKRS